MTTDATWLALLLATIPFYVYLVARLAATAYFRSKFEFHRRIVDDYTGGKD